MQDVTIINVLDREFKIKCSQEEIAKLKEAASYLDKKMREIHSSNKLLTIDRIAITAALNIAHELILAKQPLENNCNLEQRLVNLKNKISHACF